MNKKLLTKGTVVALVGLFTAPAMAEVSISGWINQAVTYADNGDRTEIASLADNGTTLGSRITFAGSSDLPGGYQAGFDVTVEPLNNNSILGFGSACGPSPADCGDNKGDFLNVLGHSLFFSGGFGKITMGLQSMPTDNIAVLEDPSLTLWSSISPVFRGNALGIVNGSTQTGFVWGDLMNCRTVPGLGIGIDCNGIYRQGVRYDLPTFVDGLGIAVGWANDDVYDVAAKYKTAFGRVNTQFAVGYAENHGLGSNAQAENLQVQVGAMDNAGTGLFGSVAYQMEDADNFADSSDAFWVKAGIKRAFNSLGDTSIAGQFGMYSDQMSPAAISAGITGSDVQRYGVEVVQYFGSAFQAYVTWEVLTPEADGVSAAALAVDGGEDLNTVTLGAVVFF
ncbi:MAG: porin [Gammaproteobacteria bacterium]